MLRSDVSIDLGLFKRRKRQTQMVWANRRNSPLGVLRELSSGLEALLWEITGQRLWGGVNLYDSHLDVVEC